MSPVHNAVPGADLRAVLPEGILAAGGMGLLLVGASLKKRRDRKSTRLNSSHT